MPSNTPNLLAAVKSVTKAVPPHFRDGAKPHKSRGR